MQTTKVRDEQFLPGADPGAARQGAAAEVIPCLLDEICDPLEAVVNLLYLLDNEAEDSAKVREYGRLLANELSHVTAAAYKCLHADSYSLQPMVSVPAA